MSPDTQSVSFASGERLEGHLALPEGEPTGSVPGVVVIHEAFGLNNNIRGVAERFAGEGYAALAVDLFAGRNRAVCMARLMGGMLRGALDHGGIRDLKASLTYLAARPEVDENRLGAIGFCMGGGLAIAWACTDDRLGAVAPYYGLNPRPLEAVRRSCPVVGSYPEKDFTRGAGEKLAAALDRYGVPNDVEVYPGARHSFFNERRPRVHDPAAAEDSWRRTLEFFEEHVGREPAGEGGI